MCLTGTLTLMSKLRFTTCSENMPETSKKSPHLNNKWESSLDLSPRVAEVMYGAPAGTYATAGLTWTESKEADEKLSWKKHVLWQNASSLNEMDFISYRNRVIQKETWWQSDSRLGTRTRLNHIGWSWVITFWWITVAWYYHREYSLTSDEMCMAVHLPSCIWEEKGLMLNCCLHPTWVHNLTYFQIKQSEIYTHMKPA